MESGAIQKKHILGRLEITRKCNQNCVFCSAPPNDTELSFEEIKVKIIELKEHGSTEIMLTGGEPTIRKDIIQILDFCIAMNFEEISIQTNGSLLHDNPILKKAKEIRNFKFWVSFHTSDEKDFEKLSGTKNYKNLIKGLKQLEDNNIVFKIALVINKVNYKTLKQHVLFLKENFKSVNHLSINFIDPTKNAEENSWIVPRFSEIQKDLYEFVDFMKKTGITFRIEKLPLCYMTGFEEYCSDIRRVIFDESRLLSRMKNDDNSEPEFKIEREPGYSHGPQCSHCFLSKLCPGVNPNYVRMYGYNELYPIFDKPNAIIERAIKSKRNRVKQ